MDWRRRESNTMEALLQILNHSAQSPKMIDNKAMSPTYVYNTVSCTLFSKKKKQEQL
jgi:hypothetical protein